MGKLAPERVSHRDDFLILYGIYMFACFFIVPWPAWWCHPKLPNYACATRSSLPADQFHTETSDRFALTWYCCKILYLSETLWFYTRGDLLPVLHDILWWYHVNKYRAMRGNRSELSLAQKLPGCHVNTR